MAVSTGLLPLHDTSLPPAAPDSRPATSRPDALWMGVCLPQLALEIGEPDHRHTAVAVYVEYRGRNVVYAATALAREQGVCRNMTLSAARALCPDLDAQPLDQPAQDKRLQRLARWMRRFSPSVSICAPNALLLEVRASERYFGGLDAIRRQVAQLLEQELGHTIRIAVSPTPAASLLLARGGGDVVVREKDELRSALGGLPVAALPLGQRQRRQMAGMGLKTLRDLWRLPRAGLNQRFGTKFNDYLSHLLGESPDIRQAFEPPPRFSSRHDFHYEVEDIARIIPLVHELLDELCDFLRRRDLNVERCRLTLFHEQRESTLVPLYLRSPARTAGRLLPLFETRLEHRELVAPVTALELFADRFSPFAGGHAGLFHDLPGAETDRPSGDAIGLLLDQLQMRLGEHGISGLGPREDLRPECAQVHGQVRDRAHCRTGVRPGKPGGDNAPRPCRPLWILDDPAPLRCDNGRVMHHGPVRLVAGPERIETGWWDGHDIRRDYHVGIDASGQRLWLYRELKGEQGWYLHGLFG